MSLSHFLTRPDDVTNGYFVDDETNHRAISYWYDRNARILTVRIPRSEGTRKFSGPGIDRLSDDELKELLIRLALEVSENLRAN